MPARSVQGRVDVQADPRVYGRGCQLDRPSRHVAVSSQLRGDLLAQHPFGSGAVEPSDGGAGDRRTPRDVVAGERQIRAVAEGQQRKQPQRNQDDQAPIPGRPRRSLFVDRRLRDRSVRHLLRLHDVYFFLTLGTAPSGRRRWSGQPKPSAHG